MRRNVAVMLWACAAFCTGCATLHIGSEPSTPRPDQRIWVDEPAVINLVTRYVYEAHFDHRRPLVERQYARLIRANYSRVSLNGKDLDGGLRAVRYIHKIHRDAKGSKDLWETVMRLAHEPTEESDLPPLPAEVR